MYFTQSPGFSFLKIKLFVSLVKLFILWSLSCMLVIFILFALIWHCTYTVLNVTPKIPKLHWYALFEQLTFCIGLVARGDIKIVQYFTCQKHQSATTWFLCYSKHQHEPWHSDQHNIQVLLPMRKWYRNPPNHLLQLLLLPLIEKFAQWWASDSPDSRLEPTL